MAKSIFSCLILLIINVGIKAQNRNTAVPFVLDTSMDGRPVIVYFGVNNLFDWPSLKSSDSLRIDSGTPLKCNRKDSTIFEIRSNPYQDTLPIDESIMTIYQVRNNDTINSKSLIVRLFPEVEVEIFLDDIKINDTFDPDSLYRAKLIRSHARFLYPSYVQSFVRFRGVHEVKIYRGETPVAYLTGWNDTGDSSRVTGIPDIKDEMRVVVEEHSLNSLAFIRPIRNGKKKPLKLSSSTPKEFKLIFE
jgi:hypothetical protein